MLCVLNRVTFKNGASSVDRIDRKFVCFPVAKTIHMFLYSGSVFVGIDIDLIR